jgi:hypothetical protein
MQLYVVRAQSVCDSSTLGWAAVVGSGRLKLEAALAPPSRVILRGVHYCIDQGVKNILIRCWDSDRALVRKYSPARAPSTTSESGWLVGREDRVQKLCKIRRSARARSHARTQSSHSEGFLCSFSWTLGGAKDRRDWMDKHPCGISAASLSWLAWTPQESSAVA